MPSRMEASGASEDLPRLLGAVRAGDRGARERLVRLCEPLVRERVEPLVRGARVAGDCSARDLCQDVLLKVLDAVGSPRFKLPEGGDLGGFIATVARNHVNDVLRARKAAKRGGGRAALPIAAGSAEEGGPPAVDPASPRTGPSKKVARDDLVDHALRLFSEEERRLVDARAHGLSWAEIAAKYGTTENAARMRHDRAIRRVRAELGLPPDISL
jgi:RNA polymerase sigma factor (sigma-70 family)